MTLFEYCFSYVIWEMAAAGGKHAPFAMTFIANRVFGPAPAKVHVHDEEADYTTECPTKTSQRVLKLSVSYC